MDSQDSSRQGMAALQDKLAAGGQLNSFLISGITNVPRSLFPYHMEMIHAVRMMLQYRYNVVFSSALLDNESKLGAVPPSQRAREVYEVDQQSVEWSDFIIAELSVPSTGTGQELERARQAGKPIIALIQAQTRTASAIKYHMEVYDGTLEERRIFVGKGGLSLMVEGNPAVEAVLTYPNDTLKTRMLQAIDNAVWRLQYATEGMGVHAAVKRFGSAVHLRLEPKNPRTQALYKLDSALQERLGLVPKTRQLREELERIKADPSLSPSQKKEMADLIEKKIVLLDNLRNFHPLARHLQNRKYELAFPEEARRLAKPDQDKGMKTSYYKRVITAKFLPSSMKGRNGNNGMKLVH
ncbi:MAG: nucleoside 2-deoxyribosyltransferase [Candidatus Marsarchaeota archaeon]|nr:nucleoside 2-deoxyribosyltransferase [Candidatus Marsarchaeota archaeon]